MKGKENATKRFHLVTARLSKDQRNQVIVVLEAASTVNDITRHFGCSRQTILYLMNWYNKTGYARVHARPGFKSSKACFHLLIRVLSNIKFNTDTLRFVYTSFKILTSIKNNVDTYAPSMLTIRYTSNKSSCYDLVVILHQYKKDYLNISILRLVKIMLVTSHRDVIAAFKAR